jgi:hypothetical protein
MQTAHLDAIQELPTLITPTLITPCATWNNIDDSKTHNSGRNIFTKTVA